MRTAAGYCDPQAPCVECAVHNPAHTLEGSGECRCPDCKVHRGKN
jgi:hypothetical protein